MRLERRDGRKGELQIQLARLAADRAAKLNDNLAEFED